jgi:aminoglycoside 3-N-acetyltransferase I
MTPKIQKLSHQNLNQFVALIRVFEAVFEMEDFQMPDENHLQNLLSTDTFHVFVALVDKQVVGGLTAYTLEQYYSERPLVYIYDLAVQTHYQRQGIGKMLMTEVNQYCKEAGMEEIFVQADEVDGHAIEFYRSTGGIAEKVIHFYYPLNTR